MAYPLKDQQSDLSTVNLNRRNSRVVDWVVRVTSRTRDGKCIKPGDTQQSRRTVFASGECYIRGWRYAFCVVIGTAADIVGAHGNRTNGAPGRLPLAIQESLTGNCIAAFE